MNRAKLGITITGRPAPANTERARFDCEGCGQDQLCRLVDGQMVCERCAAAWAALIAVSS